MSDREYTIERDGVQVTMRAVVVDGIVRITPEALDDLATSAGWTRVE